MKVAILLLLVTFATAFSTARAETKYAVPLKPKLPSVTRPLMFHLQSEAFRFGEQMPRRYTPEGEDLSPPLEWVGTPAGTAELVLIAEDRFGYRGGPWVYWVVYKLPPTLTKLPEGIEASATPSSLEGGVQGLNSWNRTGYSAAVPAEVTGRRMVFTLYALKTRLALPAGATRNQILAAMKGHILGETEITGHN